MGAMCQMRILTFHLKACKKFHWQLQISIRLPALWYAGRNCETGLGRAVQTSLGSERQQAGGTMRSLDIISHRYIFIYYTHTFLKFFLVNVCVFLGPYCNWYEQKQCFRFHMWRWCLETTEPLHLYKHTQAEISESWCHCVKSNNMTKLLLNVFLITSVTLTPNMIHEGSWRESGSRWNVKWPHVAAGLLNSLGLHARGNKTQP